MRLKRLHFWKVSNDFVTLDENEPMKIVRSVFPNRLVPKGSFAIGLRGKDFRGLGKVEIDRIISQTPNRRTFVDILTLQETDLKHLLCKENEVRQRISLNKY